MLPQQTIYVRGLPDKPAANEIRRALYLHCTQYGPVLAVHYMKSKSMYGQAFISFTNASIATTAQKALHEKEFYGKKVEVSYARYPSFAVDPTQRLHRDKRAREKRSKTSNSAKGR